MRQVEQVSCSLHTLQNEPLKGDNPAEIKIKPGPKCIFCLRDTEETNFSGEDF
jgi:hypothetical protein